MLSQCRDVRTLGVEGVANVAALTDGAELVAGIGDGPVGGLDGVGPRAHALRSIGPIARRREGLADEEIAAALAVRVAEGSVALGVVCRGIRLLRIRLLRGD